MTGNDPGTSKRAIFFLNSKKNLLEDSFFFLFLNYEHPLYLYGNTQGSDNARGQRGK